MSPSGCFNHRPFYWTVWDRFMQVLYLGRAPRKKEILPDFLKWRQVTRHPLVFRRLTDSQRTPGFWGVTPVMSLLALHIHQHLGSLILEPLIISLVINTFFLLLPFRLLYLQLP